MTDPAPPTPIISMRDVTKSFGGNTVLKGANLDVYPGETMIIMGGSGSGKSTMLRHMIGSYKPDAGTIELFGHDICSATQDEMDGFRKRFGILFQSGALFNSMTVAENVALPLKEHTDLEPELIRDIVSIKLAQVDMLAKADDFPGVLSGGQKKRAGLARALALDPQILFYDEPSAGLDPVTSARIDTLILGLTRKLGVASVVVTHEMDSAFTIADRMAMLHKGRILRVETRDWYNTLRKTSDSNADALPPDEQLIRQFLMGLPEGPMTADTDQLRLEDVLFGDSPRSALKPASVEPTRG